MSGSRLSHSHRLTKEGSRTGRAHCSVANTQPYTWTQRERERERDLLNYSLFSLLAAIWQTHKLKPLTYRLPVGVACIFFLGK